MVDPKLLSILVCPLDRGPLLFVNAVLPDNAVLKNNAVLYNPRLRKAYRVEDGIPVLLVDEAVDVGDEEHEQLIARARG